MHGIWKEKNLLLFKELVQDCCYCWDQMPQFRCLSMQIILDVHFGGTDSEMLPLGNQIYSVRHNWESFQCLSHLAGYSSKMYFSRKCWFIHICNYINQKKGLVLTIFFTLNFYKTLNCLNLLIFLNEQVHSSILETIFISICKLFIRKCAF